MKHSYLALFLFLCTKNINNKDLAFCFLEWCTFCVSNDSGRLCYLAYFSRHLPPVLDTWYTKSTEGASEYQFIKTHHTIADGCARSISSELNCSAQKLFALISSSWLNVQSMQGFLKESIHTHKKTANLMFCLNVQLTKSLLVNNGNYSIGLHTVITL